MRYAEIKDNVVMNVIILANERDWISRNGYKLIQSDTANITDTYVPATREFISKPIPTIPLTLEQLNAPILNKIRMLEELAQRPIRELALGDLTAASRLTEFNKKITALRETLRKI